MGKYSQLSRLPLRDLLNHAEHRCRELVEHLQMELTPTVLELHKITRPKRKKSVFPSLRSVCNVQEKLRKSFDYAQQVSTAIEECVSSIESRVNERQRNS